jgi:Carboxypeptidase regulatory-like domain
VNIGNPRSLLVKFVLCTLLLVLLTGTTAVAQAGRGGISGTITDPSGAIVAKAKVTALNHATGIVQQSVSSTAGLYSFVSLNPGSYEVTATVKGFDSVVEDNVTVNVDQVSTVNIALQVGGTSEVVTVIAGNDLVDASNSTVGQLISAATIDRVPLLTRNVYDLVQLSAGVTPANGSPNSSSSVAITNISTGRPNVDVSSYTINGAVQGSVYYMVDGSPLGVAENNSAAIIPALDLPEDAVDEFRVETQNTPASYQSGGAGVISLASKSGGNQFHGDGFVYLRPDVLAANDYFNKQSQLANGTANQAPSFHRYQEGGSISGPILHGKLFFFGDYEATQQEQFDGSNIFTVPTTAERTGDFSADSFAIYNPMVPDNPDGTRQAFAGNKIPNPNPIALKFLSMMPKCNFPSPATCDSATNGAVNNLYVPGLDPTTAQRFDIRTDYYLSETQRLFGRFSFDRLFTADVNAFNNDWDPNYAQNVTNGRNILFGYDYTLNANTVLQLRYSFTRHYEAQGGDPQQNGFDITSLGFPSSLAAQEVYKTLPYVLFSDVGGGVGGTANYNTLIYASENNDVNATLTKVWGKHEFSFGAEYMKRFLNVGQPPAPSGNYDFDISATDQQTSSGVGGSDFASFLVGMGEAPGVENTNFTKDLFVAEASPYYAGFFQDTFHPSTALTITAGLRWDIFGGRTERHNRLEYFNPTATSSDDGVSFTGAEVYANGNARSPYATNLKNFGPRLGVSWQPTKALLVHGGAGYYYGPSAEMVGAASLDSDGYSSTTNWNSTCYNADGNTVLNGSSLCASAAPGSVAPSTTGAYSVSNPFPAGVVPLLSMPTGLNNNLGTTLNTVLHTQRTTTTYNFNLGIEYQLPQEYVVSVGYVGSRGLFLPFFSVDLNQLDLGTIGQYQSALLNTMVPNQWGNILPATNANYGSSTVPLFAALQPYPQFGSGSYGTGNGVNVHGYPAGDSDYSSLQAKVQKRLTHHFTALASFTWAKLITDDGNPPLDFVGSHAGTPQDWRNLNLEHSVSPQDVKYQFTAQASYDLPIGKDRALSLRGPANVFLGGWTASAIAYLSTGVPIAAPLSGATPSYFNQRADMICDPNEGASHTAAQWFSPNCFAMPASPFVAGTAPAYLDHIRTMGAQDLDITLFKNLTVGKEKNLRLEVSSYNVANKAQFAAPNVPTIFNVTSDPATYASQFGQITADVNTPRQFQFGSKFTF